MVLLLLYSELSALQRSCWCSISHLGSLQLEGASHDSWCTSRHVTACHTASESSLLVCESSNLCRALLQSSAEIFSLKTPKNEELSKNFPARKRCFQLQRRLKNDGKNDEVSMRRTVHCYASAMPRLCLEPTPSPWERSHSKTSMEKTTMAMAKRRNVVATLDGIFSKLCKQKIKAALRKQNKTTPVPSYKPSKTHFCRQVHDGARFHFPVSQKGRQRQSVYPLPHQPLSTAHATQIRPQQQRQKMISMWQCVWCRCSVM